MEVIGFKHSMDMMLNQWKLPLKNFISDRPIQIRKIMREQYGPNRKDSSQPLVHHYLDPWHVAKSKVHRSPITWLSRNSCCYCFVKKLPRCVLLE